MPPRLKLLLCKHKDLNSGPHHTHEKLGGTWSPNVGDTEARRSLESTDLPV